MIKAKVTVTFTVEHYNEDEAANFILRMLRNSDIVVDDDLALVKVETLEGTPACKECEMALVEKRGRWICPNCSAIAADNQDWIWGGSEFDEP